MVTRSRIALFASLVVAVSLLPASAAVTTTTTSPAPALPGAPTSATVVNLGNLATVYEGVPGEIAGVGTAYAVDHPTRDGRPGRRVFLGFGRNDDVAQADQKHGLLVSDDGGWNFTAAPLSDQTAPLSMARLPDGRLLSVDFIPRSVAGRTATLRVHYSKDDGLTWTDESATFQAPEDFHPAFDRGMRVYRDLLVQPDGTLLLPYYTRYPTDLGYRSEIAQSTDNGRTWTWRGVIGVPDSATVIVEPTVSSTVDGQLYAVVRRHVTSSGALTTMAYSRSADAGRTWTTPQVLPITDRAGDTAPRNGVAPAIVLMPTGALALSYGRPDNWLAVSADGRGDRWEYAQVTYQNHPRAVAEYQRSHGSGGNTGIAVAGRGKLVVVGDNCHPSWGCPGDDIDFTVDNKYRMWRRFVDILPPGDGLIDLAGKHRAGLVTVDTDLNSRPTPHPEAQPAAAFDGSISPWASAVKLAATGKGTFTVKLDREYTLNRIGLSLRIGHAQSAKMSVSTDGTTWSQPVVATGDITSQALRYYNLPAPAPARYVRVELQGPEAQPLFLNEIELYSTVDSFENEAPDAAPRGYSETVGATVLATGGRDSTQVLQLADGSPEYIAKAARTTQAAAAQALEFSVKSVRYDRTFTFGLSGEVGAAAVPAYHMGLFTDGSVGVYDFGKAAWQKLTAARAVDIKAWTTFRLQATPTGATLFVNGSQVATVPPSTAGVTALTGFSFASAGTATTGSVHHIDDVSITSS